MTETYHVALERNGETVETLASQDPTNSITKRSSFTKKFRSRWRTARGEVRSLLRKDRHYQPGSNRSSDSEKIADFRQWLDAMLNEVVVEAAPQRAIRRGRHYTTPYVKDFYLHGLKQADKSLRSGGWEFSAPSPEGSLRFPPHEDLLKQEYLAVYQDLEDAVDAAEKEATREYRDAVREESSVSDTIDAVNDRLDKTGRHRTDLVANSEAVMIINDASIARYDQIGAEEVGVVVEMVPEDSEDALSHDCSHETVEVLRTDRTQPAPSEDSDEDIHEWSTSGDLRVCETCASMAGSHYRLEEIQSGDAPMPVRDTHPNCRCAFVAAY